MWWKWFPWRFVVRDVARRQGFLDPIKIISQLQNFTQPSEVAAPTELLRSGVVLHARGLMNSLAIQHNLDWVWPYWVECQYNPRNKAFIPRSFSLTQINLTHRNWTALGVPDSAEFPIVDPRGLVTPHYDSWSIDAWIIPEEGKPLIPSRVSDVSQKLIMDENLCVITKSRLGELKLDSKAQVVIGPEQSLTCNIQMTGFSSVRAKFIVSLRPYNPEGVSFINTISLLNGSSGWLVNQKNVVCFDQAPERSVFSYYYHGDVYNRLSEEETKGEIFCKVGMATAAAIYTLGAGKERTITLSIPLMKFRDPEISSEKQRDISFEKEYEGKERNKTGNASSEESIKAAQLAWEKSLFGVCALQIPDERFQFLYEAALRTMVLHSPKEVYPGPYIYRRFWFRDAAFILYALLCVGLKDRVRRALDCFRFRQTPQGYFLSQEGEWDSNGEALWVTRQYCEMTGNALPKDWKNSILKGGKWICKKRLSSDLKFDHAGLMPAGFSAEHLGPNDFYYWDDFWSVAGLRAADFLTRNAGQHDVRFEEDARELSACVDRSLEKTAQRLKRPAIPASVYRRMDTGAIGSLSASYPLRLLGPNDQRILDTVDFLMEKCLINGGFFHDMTHSGINPYLTLHLAQVLLRAGDPRYFNLMSAVAGLATSTGQWPEAIHPGTGGGCMGDGQHVWAAAEWVLMIRNCFVREEGDQLILCSGIPRIWLEKKQTISFGPALTRFGSIEISIRPREQHVVVAWSGQWHAQEPPIDIQLAGFAKEDVVSGENCMKFRRVEQS